MQVRDLRPGGHIAWSRAVSRALKLQAPCKSMDVGYAGGNGGTCAYGRLRWCGENTLEWGLEKVDALEVDRSGV